jgi:GntR family transcriptional regulator
MEDNDTRISSPDRRPLYAKAINAIYGMIEKGDYRLGDMLPSESELCEMLGISRSTLRAAMAHLETYGLIIRQRGRGTFVTKPSNPGVAAGIARLETLRSFASLAGSSHNVVSRQVSTVPATERIAGLMVIDKDDPLILVELVEALDDNQCMYIENYLLPWIATEDGIRAYEGSVLTYLMKDVEHQVLNAYTEIFAIDAPPEIAKKLDVQPGRSILHLIDTYYTVDGKIAAAGLVYFLTDHFHFFINRHAVEW